MRQSLVTTTPQVCVPLVEVMVGEREKPYCNPQMASGSDGWRPAFSLVEGLFLSAGRVGTWLASPTSLASIRGCVRDQVYITGSSHDGWFVRNCQSSDINHSLKWRRKPSDRVRRDGKSLSHNKSALLLILTKDPQNILRTLICSMDFWKMSTFPHGFRLKERLARVFSGKAALSWKSDEWSSEHWKKGVCAIHSHSRNKRGKDMQLLDYGLSPGKT